MTTEYLGTADGSSPRWRGKREEGVHDFVGVGLIPALAGKTARSPWAHPARPAHPRAGGENTISGRRTLVSEGSSPRWRGKRVGGAALAAGCRLIPALAGKTRATLRVMAWSSAHPRAGGENAHARASASWPAGSSPRWRGKPVRASRCLARLGLIPALAGKTRVVIRRTGQVGAHPRAGGENLLQLAKGQDLKGSSPRWRGKRRGIDALRRSVRLIPALAGKTRARQSRLRRRGAHPRAGGENGWALHSSETGRGSSPRWRGKPGVKLTRLGDVRLIPALAGKTPRDRPPPRHAQAHPRAGGENHGGGHMSGRRSGSSPRWRGKRCGDGLPVAAPGLIPALAGKTRKHAPLQTSHGAHPRAGGEN